MNLPSWARYVAVDADGQVCAYDARPVWSDGYGGMWLCASPMRRCEDIDEIGTIDPALARLLCVPVPGAPESP